MPSVMQRGSTIASRARPSARLAGIEISVPTAVRASRERVIPCREPVMPMPTAAGLKRTPLHAAHVEAGARLVDFAGWEMPVSYSGILAEHLAVRRAAGLFDVSHMGEIRVVGGGAESFVDWLTPNRVRGLVPGRAQYNAILTERGTFVDDLIVYRLEENVILLVVNASNLEKDLAWVRERAEQWAGANPAAGPAEVFDDSDATALLALQGPLAAEILAPLTGADLAAMRSFRLAQSLVAGAPAIVSRTGYTGEDGFEIFIAPDDAAAVWRRLLEAGRDRGLLPIGLGARDSLRLEAGLCLYGHEIDDTVTPFEASLDWVVKLEGRDFVGRDALVAQRAAGVPRRLLGLELPGRRIGRAEARVWTAGGTAEPIGKVTSGTWSPFVERSIAMARLDAGHAAAGTRVEVEVRDAREPAQVRALPFYRHRL
jgi:aminomethyltransferase